MHDDADILVGADGIHSAVRRNSIRPKASRGSRSRCCGARRSRAEPFLGGRTMIIAGHFHQRIIVYPIGRGRSPAMLTNWICQMTVPGRGAAARGLEPARVEGASAGRVRRVAVSMARHARADRATRNLRISPGRSRSGADMDSGASRCSATPPIRCSRSAPRPARRRSSTPGCSPPLCCDIGSGRSVAALRASAGPR